MRGATQKCCYRKFGNDISIHAPRAGRDFRSWSHCWRWAIFQSTRPVRGATNTLSARLVMSPISIHAPRAGRDEGQGRKQPALRHFNPRAPCGARPCPRPPAGCQNNFNPRAPCGARQAGRHRVFRFFRISIHAPRAGRDVMFSVGGTVSTLFQSTRPVRGATAIFLTTFSITGNFNPRAPCGARRKTRRCCCQARNFNPRAPCGARQDGAGGERCPEDFNPRAPCGARRDTKAAFAPSHEFQSTRPVRGATLTSKSGAGSTTISIHAPRAGRDSDGTTT